MAVELVVSRDRQVGSDTGHPLPDNIKKKYTFKFLSILNILKLNKTKTDFIYYKQQNKSPQSSLASMSLHVVI